VVQRKQRKKKSARRRGAELARNARKRVADGADAARRSVSSSASMERVRDLGESARSAIQRRTAFPPYLCLVRAPALPIPPVAMGREITIASYNVHRWTGMNGRARPDPARASYVISDLPADLIALQEVLRPYQGEDPLEKLCESLGLHLAFAATRLHKRGQLGNAILSRFPMAGLSVLDISNSRIERRGALAAQFSLPTTAFGMLATHLSLVDRTRRRQVALLLDHPQLNAGPAVLVGDMNAWHKCKASQSLEDALHRHHNVDWPPTFPAARAILALDRIYARGAEVVDVYAHETPASRRASDHVPIVARLKLAKHTAAPVRYPGA